MPASCDDGFAQRDMAGNFWDARARLAVDAGIACSQEKHSAGSGVAELIRFSGF